MRRIPLACRLLLLTMTYRKNRLDCRRTSSWCFSKTLYADSTCKRSPRTQHSSHPHPIFSEESMNMMLPYQTPPLPLTSHSRHSSAVHTPTPPASTPAATAPTRRLPASAQAAVPATTPASRPAPH